MFRLVRNQFDPFDLFGASLSTARVHRRFIISPDLVEQLLSRYDGADIADQTSEQAQWSKPCVPAKKGVVVGVCLTTCGAPLLEKREHFAALRNRNLITHE